jgi:hypothetical protein
MNLGSDVSVAPSTAWLLRAYAYLGVVGLASALVPRMLPWVFVLAVAVLAIPWIVGVAHRATVASAVSLHQYRPGGWLHFFGSRRWWSTFFGAIVAAGLTALLLLHSVLWSALEWLLVAILPLMAAALHWLCCRSVEAQYTNAVYASRLVSQLTIVGVTMTGAVLWIAAAYLWPAVPDGPTGAELHRVQQQWAAAPSHTVRWALDALAAVDVAAARAFERSAGWWKSAALLVLAPVGIFIHLTSSVLAFRFDRHEVRRAFATVPTSDPSPPAVGFGPAATWGAVSAVLLLAALPGMAALERWTGLQPSPMAVKPVANCVRIGGEAYALAALPRILARLEAGSSNHRALREQACARVDELERAANAGIDKYLDGYFSLWGEWTRIATLLASNADDLMARKFEEQVIRDPAFADALQQVAAGLTALDAHASTLAETVRKELDDSRIVADAGQCVATQPPEAIDLPPEVVDLQGRLVASGGAGLVVGGVAAKITSQTMAKAGVKLAAKALSKVALKQAGAKATGAAIGGFFGTLFGAGIGASVGAAAGAVLGVGVSLLFDWGLLAIEERANRETMKAELLDAVRSALLDTRQVAGCGTAVGVR